MSCLQNEILLEQCYEDAYEQFRISNKLTVAQLDELLNEDELIGGLSVANRVDSILEKIINVLSEDK